MSARAPASRGLTRGRGVRIIRRVWRAEDEALLERTEDEICFERLWRREAPAAPLPSLRGAGMIALVRRDPEGREAVREALAGRVDPLRQALYPKPVGARAPELFHHLASFEAAVADAVAESNPGAAFGADVRSIAAWLALGEEQRYLRALGEAVAGADLAAAELDRALADAPFTRIDALGRRAHEGARDRTARAGAALAALAGVPEAVRQAGCGEALARAATARAERHRMSAVDEALAPLDEALNAAVDRGQGMTAGPEIFLQVQAAWAWAGRDEGVERFAAERSAKLLWEAYRITGWKELGRLIAALSPLADRLASRIEADPSQIAYAGHCAQLLCFAADVEPTLEKELELVERALRVCPSHRNSRSHLARRLCQSASRACEHGGAAELARAEAEVTRAEKLFPSLEVLGETREKIAAGRKRMAGSHA